MGKADQVRALRANAPAVAIVPDAFNDDDFQPGTGRTMKARPMAITDILPDPAQPRRAVPSAARATWDGKSTAESVQVMLQAWVDLAAHELGDPLRIYVATEPPADYERIEVEETTTPITFKLLKLVDLANDIFLNGLTEPIHVTKLDEGYRAESGERRWLAHWWLFLATGDAKWSKINAFVRDEFSVWRQASENGARQQLNAIELARQVARLLMDIHKSADFKSYAEMVQSGASDRAYYAQVSDGDRFRIPRGMGEKIAAAMGLPNVQMIRQYRALLRLPDEKWIEGDDQSWTENALRPYTVSTDTVSNSNGHRDKARAMTEEETQFNANVRAAIAVLRHERQVNVKVVKDIMAFCQGLIDSGKVFEPEPKR